MASYTVIHASLQDEYEREGVDVSQVSYVDNRPLLELLMTVSHVHVHVGSFICM